MGPGLHPRPRVGIIGSGISGMAAAYLLNRVADITVLEKDVRPGGHANTVDVEETERKPLEELGVKSRDSDMSFSVKAKVSGLEYCGTSLGTIFAQRKNLFKPWFYRMLWDILRFNRTGNRILTEASHGEWSLGRYLDEEGYGRRFREYYVLPMGAAIWSTPPAQMLDFPLRSFLLFLANHGMLGVDPHFQWRTISGGSREYVKKLMAPFQDKVQYRSGARSVRHDGAKVKVELEDGRNLEFDKVVMATHADITLKILSDARALGGAPCLHYHMNRLQGLASEREYLVSLNPADDLPRPDAHYRTLYEHPLYSVEGMGRQKEIEDLNGRDGNQVFICGANCEYGFHEDGLRFAVAVAKRFGVDFG